MTTDQPTPRRKCDAHFGMHDLQCSYGCTDICVRADPGDAVARITELARELAEARAQLATAREDAERYRLAKKLNEPALIAIAYQVPAATAYANVDAAFDAAIDEARKGMK